MFSITEATNVILNGGKPNAQVHIQNQPVIATKAIIRAYNAPSRVKKELEGHGYLWKSARQCAKPHFYKIVENDTVKLELKFLSSCYDSRNNAKVEPCLLSQAS